MTVLLGVNTAAQASRSACCVAREIDWLCQSSYQLLFAAKFLVVCLPIVQHKIYFSFLVMHVSADSVTTGVVLVILVE